ncbi:MAG: alpha/beta hydrolase [Hymenobacter sp.]
MIGLAPYGLTGAEIAVQQQEATLKSLQTAPAQVAAAVKRQQAMFEIIRQTPDNAQAQAIVANMLRQSNPSLDETTAQTSAAEMVTDRYRYYLSFNPAEELPKITCPVLLLYGSADSVLNPDNNLAPLTRSLKANKAVTVRKLAGVNHFV